MPKCSEIAAVQFSREMSESSLKYSGCCGAAANRRSFSPNVDSRAGGRTGDVSLTSVQVSQTFHNEDVARAKSNETLCEADAPASEALHTAAAGRGALQDCRRDCESRARAVRDAANDPFCPDGAKVFTFCTQVKVQILP